MGKQTHGMTHTRIYRIWCKMKERCNNPNIERYPNYGGRGIKVCYRWNNSFESFYEDMKDGYSDNLSIERIDVNGNYEPSNCTWIPIEKQYKNKTNNVKFVLEGEEILQEHACQKYGITWKVASRALKNGFTPEQIFIEKVDTYTTAHWVELNGEKIHFDEACRKYKVNEKTARKMLKQGFSYHDIFVDKKYTRRDRVRFELNGQSTYLAEACRIYDITEKVATNRLNKGFTPHQIFITKEAI